MDSKRRPPDWTLERERGVARVHHAAPGVVLIVMKGDLDASFARPLADALERAFADAQHVETYWDLEHLEQYDSSVRVACTRVLTAHRGRMEVIHTYSKSRIVKMGVSVANLAVGGIIRQHDVRATFQHWLDQAVRDRAGQPA